MKKFRKLAVALGIGLAITAVTGMFASCKKEEPVQDVMNHDSLYPIIKEEYQDTFKLTMMAPSYYTVDPDWENNKFFIRMNELTGVDFDFQVFNYEMYGTKKPLALSNTSQMPDFFMKAMFDKTEIVKYGSQGLIIPLEDLIEEYMPNLKKLMDNDPKVAQLITAPDGHIYSLPTIGDKDTYNFVGLPWINQQWLDNLGLEMPETPEEFYNVLKAFRDDDPNQNGLKDETPMYGRGIENQGEYFHRYICGLYGILSKIRSTYPGVLFESCASGGNRYDLGMLYFMPQIWASDNTDAFDRLFIQEGTLYGYPQNSMGAHVSACPNHQTGNSTSIENRFNVAALGLLGYELDLSKLSEKEFSAVKEQVDYYKAHRALVQRGNYYRLDSAFKGNYAGAIIVSEDKREALAFVAVQRKITGVLGYRFFLKGLDGNKKYRVEVRKQCDVEKSIIFTACGNALMSGSVFFGDLFDENSRSENSASLASRLVYLKEID